MLFICFDYPTLDYNNPYKYLGSFVDMAIDWGIQVIGGVVHKQYLRMAYDFAFDNVFYPKSRVGAIITNSGLDKVLGKGTNHPSQIGGAHAEVMAVRDARENGFSVEGSVMYMPWVPCKECAELMVSSGIKTYIAHKQMIDRTTERWIESCKEGVEILRRGGVASYMVDGKIGGVLNRLDGTLWAP